LLAASIEDMGEAALDQYAASTHRLAPVLGGASSSAAVDDAFAVGFKFNIAVLPSRVRSRGGSSSLSFGDGTPKRRRIRVGSDACHVPATEVRGEQGRAVEGDVRRMGEQMRRRILDIDLRHAAIRRDA
jgi:hypothetical protein